MEDKVSISLKYVDKNVYDQIIKIVNEKGLKTTKKKEIIDFVLSDYVQISTAQNISNPYLIKDIKSIIEARCELTEKNLGNRMTSLMAELAINQGVLNRIIIEFLNKYGDTEQTRRLLNQYRQEAVEDLRMKKKPINYIDLIRDAEDNE